MKRVHYLSLSHDDWLFIIKLLASTKRVTDAWIAKRLQTTRSRVGQIVSSDEDILKSRQGFRSVNVAKRVRQRMKFLSEHPEEFAVCLRQAAQSGSLFIDKDRLGFLGAAAISSLCSLGWTPRATCDHLVRDISSWFSGVLKCRNDRLAIAMFYGANLNLDEFLVREYYQKARTINDVTNELNRALSEASIPFVLSYYKANHYLARVKHIAVRLGLKSKREQSRAAVCPQCGRSFIATHYRRIFCSKKCAMKNGCQRRKLNEPKGGVAGDGVGTGL